MDKGLLEAGTGQLEFDPLYSGNFKASAKTKTITELGMNNPEARKALISEAQSIIPLQAYIAKNSPSFLQGNYNLYKCFIGFAGRISSPNAINAFLHDSGTYESANEAPFKNTFHRLSLLLRFENQLQLFPELGHARTFEASILQSKANDKISFL